MKSQQDTVVTSLQAVDQRSQEQDIYIKQVSSIHELLNASDQHMMTQHESVLRSLEANDRRLQILDISIKNKTQHSWKPEIGPEDAIRTLHAVSRVKCASECSFSPQCIDFSYYATSRLCYFYSFVPQKIHYDSDCTFMMKLDPLSDCPISGLPFQLEIGIGLGEGPVLLPTLNNWIVLLHRLVESLDFNRTWIEYRNGFGEIGRGEFWLGNEKVHRLTNRFNHTLRIEVQLNATGGWYYADYATFSLYSESNKYALRLSGFSGNAGDSLTNTAMLINFNIGGMNFTTSDSDNDRSPYSNCAQSNGGGWWFNNCRRACLTCHYNNQFYWYTLRQLSSDGIGQLRAARMMIKST